jgi:hypothetical protein
MSNTQNTNNTNQNTKKGCDNYQWDPSSALNKLAGGTTINVNLGVVSASKTLEHHDPKKDAYRNCKNCGTHVNYHKK